MGNRNHGSLLRKATAAGLACLLLVAGLPLPASAEESCKDWNTAKFFESATVDEVRACLSAGRDPNEQDPKGLTALHRAVRDTADPAVIDALLDAGADPEVRNTYGRPPWFYARKNKRIKGSDAYQRLRIRLTKKVGWARVQALANNTKTRIWLYQDTAPPESRKIKGRFESATADSITLLLKDGQTRSYPKTAVHKVLTRRPYEKRTLGWVALGATSLFCIVTVGPWDLVSGVYLVIPAAAAAGFSVSGTKEIYHVPPEHRMLLNDKQSSAQNNASGSGRVTPPA